MDIKCVFYSEFDVDIGAVLCYQKPADFISQEIFRMLQTFIIPDKLLCGKFTVLKLKPDLCLVGLPVNILAQKYERNVFGFNFGMLVTEQCFNQLENRMVLEHVIRKMAVYLTSLELEHEILSKKQNQFLETFMEKLS